MRAALDPVPWLVLRAGLAALFAAAAAHKLRDLPGFRAALSGYALLPGALVPAAALALAGVELAVAVLCLLPPAGAAGPLGAAGLLALYGAAIAANLARGRGEIDCGCGGPGGGRPLGAGLVARNALLAVLALLAAPPAAPRPPVWLDAASVACGLGALVLAYAALDVALANAARLRRGGGAWSTR